MDNYVRVTGNDWQRLGERADEFAHFIGNRAYLRMRDGHCAALTIRPASEDSAHAEYFCTIYADRPQICRDLTRGSAECYGELARKAPLR